MTKITSKQALKGLKSAVDKRGRDYVIPDGGCRYVTPISGAPSCLVGQALADLGVSVSEVFNQSNANGASFNSSLVRDALEDAGVTFTSKALDILSSAQNVQDNNQPWGEALDKALNVFVADE